MSRPTAKERAGIFSGGWNIPKFGNASGMTAIRSADVNEQIIRPLNALGSMTIVKGDSNSVNYAEGNVQIVLKSLPGTAGNGAITVEEEDLNPTEPNCTKIRFPNGSVTSVSPGVVSVSVASGLTVEEQDGAPTVSSVTKIKFTNGTVTDNTGGVVSVAIAAERINAYQIDTVDTDWLNCHKLDSSGSPTGGSVAVAKPPKLMKSLVSATIDGIGVTYTHTSNTTRTATISAVDELQVIVPRYNIGDTIYAATPENYVGVSGKTLIDINVDGRAWCKKA